MQLDKLNKNRNETRCKSGRKNAKRIYEIH